MKTYRLGSPAAMRLEPPLDPPEDEEPISQEVDDFDGYDQEFDDELQVSGF